MSDISIKVTIANRQYPLKIRKDDEPRVRKAVQMINERIKEFESQYAVNDKFDLVAMSAIHFATEHVNMLESETLQEQSAKGEVAGIDNLISEYFRKTNVH